MVEKPVTVFELVAGNAALDLVNTLDFRFRESGADELLNDYGALLRFAVQAGLISDARGRRLRHAAEVHGEAGQVLTEVRALREATSAVAYALLAGGRVPPAGILTLQRYCARAGGERRMVVEGVGLRWSWQDALARPAAPLWLLAQEAADLFLSDRVKLLRSCANESCRWLFLDTSKNHTRRWCDMKVCGNRMKAKRFQARLAEG